MRLANARLDPRQRLVLALCELEDRSYAEIGELVGLNENAVAQLVFRARERLRTELRLVQVDPESLPEECRAFLPLLAQHLDGRLKGPKLDETLGHLESCERCQAALADMREAKRRYRALLLPPLGVPAEEARAAIEDELERAGYWRGGAARRTVLRRPRGRKGAGRGRGRRGALRRRRPRRRERCSASARSGSGVAGDDRDGRSHGNHRAPAPVQPAAVTEPERSLHRSRSPCRSPKPAEARADDDRRRRSRRRRRPRPSHARPRRRASEGRRPRPSRR